MDEPKLRPIDTAPLGKLILLYWASGELYDIGEIAIEDSELVHYLHTGYSYFSNPTHWHPLPKL